jgi:autotransporter-associated beta strand protein
LGANGNGALLGNITWGGPITLARNSLVVGDVSGVSGDITLTGAISGPGSLNLDEVTLAGNQQNTYTGGTVVVGGSLFLDKPGMNAIPGSLLIGGPNTVNFPVEAVLLTSEQVPATAPVTIDGGFLTDTGSTPSSETIGPLTLNDGFVTIHGTLTLNGDVTVQGAPALPNVLIDSSISSPLVLGATVRTFNLADANARLTLSGPISGGTDALTKNGPGILVVSGGGTYTGVTTVNGGTLEIAGNGHPLQSRILLNPGTLLEGNPGATSAVAGITAIGATVAPGSGRPVGTGGLLTSNGNVSFDSASTFDLSETVVLPFGILAFSQLNVTGTVSLGNAKLNDFLTFPFAPGSVGQTFDIISSTGGISGTFAGLPEGTIFPILDANLNQQFYQITYHGGTGGHDVVLTHVNAPAAAFQNRSVTTPVTEGRFATLTGTIVDPNAHGTFLLRVDWGDGSLAQIFAFPADAGTVHVQHLYPDNAPGTSSTTYTVQLAWRDTLGPSKGADLQATVNDVPPEVHAGGNTTIAPGGTLQRTGRLGDADSDVSAANVDYGDGSGVQPLAITDRHFRLQHQYQGPGQYTVAVTVQDDDGLAGTASFVVIVPPPSSLAQADVPSAGTARPTQVLSGTDQVWAAWSSQGPGTWNWESKAALAALSASGRHARQEAGDWALPGPDDLAAD